MMLSTLRRYGIKVGAATALLLAVTAGSAFAQTTTTTGTGTTVTTPGVPTTGAGGNMPINLVLLGSSALLTVAGLATARRLSLS